MSIHLGMYPSVHCGALWHTTVHLDLNVVLVGLKVWAVAGGWSHNICTGVVSAKVWAMAGGGFKGMGGGRCSV